MSRPFFLTRPTLIANFLLIGLQINEFCFAQGLSSVQIEAIEPRLVQETRFFQGRVVSSSTATISASVSGKLLWLEDFGKVVNKGDVVAVLDDFLISNTKKKYASDVKHYQNQLEISEDRLRSLQKVVRNNNISKVEIEDLELKVNEFKNLLDNSAINLARQGELIKKTQVRSPISGKIVVLYREIGEWIDKTAVILKIIDGSDVHIKAIISSSFATMINDSDLVAILCDGSLSQGIVVSKAIQPDFKYYEVRIKFLVDALPIGSACKIGFSTYSDALELTVPVNALHFGNGEVGVFQVDNESVVSYVPVTILAVSDNYAAVDTNLNKGDAVVTRGLERLQHGQTVKIVNHIVID